MKKFQQYLAESERTYNYRIKVVGDVPAEFFSSLKEKLAQFDVVKYGAAKSTPIQAKPADFPSYANDKVTSIDVEFRYPAIEPQIRQISQLLGLDPNKVIMLTTPHEDSLDIESKKVENQPDPLLTADYPAPDAEQQALSKDYSAPYDEHAVLKNTYRSDFTVAGGKTPKAVTTNDLPMGDKSPMTKITRPAKPATGANPRG